MKPSYHYKGGGKCIIKEQKGPLEEVFTRVDVFYELTSGTFIPLSIMLEKCV
jgi:hypothetical protein